MTTDKIDESGAGANMRRPSQDSTSPEGREKDAGAVPVYPGERIDDLQAQHECIGNPYNESPKHWIGINPATAPDELLKELTQNSYEIVKAKYTKRK